MQAAFQPPRLPPLHELLSPHPLQLKMRQTSCCRRVDLEKAIAFHGGPALVAAKLGWTKQGRARKPRGYWDSLPNVRAEIDGFIEENDLEPGGWAALLVWAFCGVALNPLGPEPFPKEEGNGLDPGGWLGHRGESYFRCARLWVEVFLGSGAGWVSEGLAGWLAGLERVLPRPAFRPPCT